jgi:O-succinylbenzoate synthase
MAKAALEGAVLDAELRATGRSMARFLWSQSVSSQSLPSPSSGLASSSAQAPRPTVVAGVAAGLRSTTGELLDEVERYVSEGYRRVKLKIVPGRDLGPVSAVRERWPDLVLMADANGSYRRLAIAEAVVHLAALGPYRLACIEQPLADDDLSGHAQLARQLETPICLDEALTSYDAVVTALEMRACSVVNVKPGRLGGYLEAVRVHDMCASRRIAAWCGGMVETGIGRAANVALAALPNFALPGDVAATGRFFDEDLTSPLPLRPDGTIAVPDAPGTGVFVCSDAVARFSTWRQWCPAH